MSSSRESAHFGNRFSFSGNCLMMAASRAKSSEHSVLYKALFRRIPLPVALVDGDLVVRDASQAYANVAGRDLPSLLGAPLAVVFASGETATSFRAAAASGEHFSCEAASLGGLPVHLDVDPVEDEEGATALVVLRATPNGA